MKTHLNLLPWKYRRRQLVRQRLFQWSIPWLAAAAVCAGLVWLRYDECQAIETEVGELERQCAPLDAMQREIHAGRLRLAEIEAKETIVVNLEERRPPLTLLGLVSRAAQSCGGRLRIDQLTASAETGKTAATTEKGKENERPRTAMRVEIKGTANDAVDAARFVAALRDSHAFDRVELKSAAEQTTGPRACVYCVECAY